MGHKLFEGFKVIVKVITCRNECLDEMIWMHNRFLFSIHDHGTDYSLQRKVQQKSF
jgi:hypothetical protein